MSRDIRVHDKAVVLVLTKKEAEALDKWLALNTGMKKTIPLLKAEEKLAVQLMTI